MDDPPETLGTILLPDNPETESGDGFVRGRNRSDAGFCISGIFKGKRCWVNWTQGKWFKGFIGNDVFIDAQVQLYGIVNSNGAPQLQPLDDAILAIEDIDMEGNIKSVKPLGRNLLILRSKAIQGSVLIANPVRDHKAVVLASGRTKATEEIPDDPIKVGASVVYQAAGLYPFDAIRCPDVKAYIMDTYNLDEERLDDLALIHEKYIYGYV